VAASDPGGRREIRRYTIENFSHEAGKSAASMNELMDWEGLEALGEIGKEKFCTRRNFPGFPGLGIIDNGEDW
jgi:hypothetical protein